MYGVRHYLHDEFPHLSDTFSTLKTENPGFARLLSEYDSTDKRIYGLEISCRPASDACVDSLKKRRVHLKDKIHRTLNGVVM